MNTTGLPIQVVGFEVFTTTNVATVQTGKTGLLLDLSGPGATAFTQPAATNSANGKITVSPGAAAWYSTSVYPPMTFQPGEVFWFHVDAYSLIAPPQHTVTGGVAGPVANWWRRPTTNMVWAVSGSVARQIFRVHCVSASPTVPVLTATGTPQFGTTFTMNIAGGGAFAPGFIVWGLDRTQWLAMPTPVDLVLFGAPGCFVQTSTDTTALVLLDGSGVGSATMGIPTDPSFGGFTFYNQAAVLSSGANQLGVLVANAATAIIGN